MRTDIQNYPRPADTRGPRTQPPLAQFVTVTLLPWCTGLPFAQPKAAQISRMWITVILHFLLAG